MHTCHQRLHKTSHSPRPTSFYSPFSSCSFIKRMAFIRDRETILVTTQESDSCMRVSLSRPIGPRCLYLSTVKDKSVCLPVGWWTVFLLQTSRFNVRVWAVKSRPRPIDFVCNVRRPAFFAVALLYVVKNKLRSYHFWCMRNYGYCVGDREKADS